MVAKVLLSIDDALLAEIDRAARDAGLSRSAYVVRVTRQEIARSSEDRMALTRDAFRRMDRLFSKVPPGDSTAELRAERDAH